MKDIVLVLPEKFDEPALLQVMARLSRRQPLRIGMCSRELQLSDNQCQFMAGLEAMGATVSAHLSVTAESLAGMQTDLALVAWPTSYALPQAWRNFIRDLSRRLPASVWIMNGHTGPPSAVTALIDPDGADRLDPHLAAEVLRVAFTLSRLLDVPLDIINVWYFLEEGLLRSWRLRTPEPEIAQGKRRAAWIAQSDLARVLATLPPDLSWRRLNCLQGPVTDSLERIVSNDRLVVAGSAGRDGWAARFRPNLAEDLCRRQPAQVVIVKKPDAQAIASLACKTLQDGSDEGTYQTGLPGRQRKR